MEFFLSLAASFPSLPYFVFVLIEKMLCNLPLRGTVQYGRVNMSSLIQSFDMTLLLSIST